MKYKKFLDPFYKQLIIKIFKKYSKNYSFTLANGSKILSSNTVDLGIYPDFLNRGVFLFS